MKRIIPALVLWATLTGSAVSQSMRPLGEGDGYQKSKFEVGALAGFSNYQGDLAKTLRFNYLETRPALGVFGRYQIDQRWAARANALVGWIGGSDSHYDDRKARGWSFTASLLEFSAQAEWEPFGPTRFLNLGDMDHFERIVSPYAFIGAGMLHFKPKTEFNEAGQSPDMIARINLDKTENFSETVFTLPFGVGAKVDIDRDWMVGAEVGFRTPFSDFLDGVSNAGNPDRKDWYLMGGLTVARRFWGPRDRDGDGTPDKRDACPEEPGSTAMKGCPEKVNITEEEKLELAEAVYGVQFETGKSALKKESFPVLDKVAGIMAKYPGYGLRIEGHTDDVGEAGFNQTLSESRAIACYDYLVAHGVSDARMRTAGFGESRPIASNETAEGKAKNRRVEFVLFVR